MSDLDDLKLPPRRPLPPEVRDRMRATVLGGIRTPGRTRTHRARPPLAVAAGVAVLALGATILTQSLAGSHGIRTGHQTDTTAPGTPPPLNLADATADMDRCWAAVVRGSKAGSVPTRSTWQAVFAVPGGNGLTVTAIRADGNPLICETTRTTVTVSDPNASPAYAAATRTGALLNSADGVVAGVMDPRWSAMQFVAVGKSGASDGGPGFFQDGMFVDIGGFAPGGRYTVQQTVPDAPESPTSTVDSQYYAKVSPSPLIPTSPTYPELTLPAAPAALVATVDRPDPPTDRTSAAGQFLGECIAKSDQAVLDPDSWQPLVLAGASPNMVVLARSGNRIASCGSYGPLYPPNDIGYEFGSRPPPPAANKPIQYVASTSYPADMSGRNQTVIFVGVVRSDVTTVKIIAPGGAQRSVSVVGGTFNVEFTGLSQLNAYAGFTAVLADNAGGTVYTGPIEPS